MALFADAILSRIVTDLLKQPSSMHDEWWTVEELLFHAGEEWTDMGPTPIGNDTFFAAYLHLWADQGGPTPLALCWAVCEVGLIHWACQPNKESIYLVSEGPLSKDLAEDGGTGYPEKLWCVRLIRADTDSSTSSPPHPPLRRTINPRRMRKEKISPEEPQALASYFEPGNGFLAA